ncbi:hypothetical protein [Streptomyces sp. ISL-36]|uniref:hypothetical protein n=1 Tax=Streptomyces sp. ISL-36 TaxID=2819182 RepID=UPI00203530AE|nr:hypothetical protein [Streptomyces sp. ISL-36]
MAATLFLLTYLETFRVMAEVAARPGVGLDEVRNVSPALHAGPALLVLSVAMVLAVFKPRGMTPYGQRRQYEQRTRGRGTAPVS